MNQKEGFPVDWYGAEASSMESSPRQLFPAWEDTNFDICDPENKSLS